MLALTVNFDDADRAASDTLQVGAITITQPVAASSLGKPTTAAGSGLGSAGNLGLDFEVNETLHFAPGSVFSDAQSYEGLLNFNVDGILNSMTIVPECRIFNSIGDLLTDNITFLLIAHAAGSDGSRQFLTLDPSAGPTTIYFTYSTSPIPPRTSADLQLISDLTSEWRLTGYRSQHLSEEQTIEIGYTVQSINYTPAPEPGTAAIMGIGFLMFLARGRRRHPGAS